MLSRRRQHTPLRFGLLTLFTLMWALLLVSGCAVAPVPIENEPWLSQSDEQMLWRRGREAQQAALEGGKIYANASVAAYVNQVAAVLRPRTSPPALKFRTHVVGDPFMNAYAYPDGGIFITTGLLARLENEAQLAAVLAHEMAHVLGRDALRAYRQCSDTGGGGAAGRHGILGSRTGTHGPSEELSECLKDVGRLREAAADACGLDMLVQAKYDPAAALRVFNHQKEALSIDGATSEPATGSHPLWDERMEAVGRLLADFYEGADSGKSGRAEYDRQIQPVLLVNAGLNLRRGRYQWARADLGRFLQIQPGDARAHFLLGETYQQQGGKARIQNALACYREAIRLDGRYAAPQKALGMLHFKQGRKLLARRYLQTALALSPDDTDSAYLAEYLAECQN